MATQGPLTADSAADDAGVGTVAWTNASNALTENSSYATAALMAMGSVSHYLVWTDFDFTIPAGATIDDISVTFNCSRGANPAAATVTDVRLVVGGVIDDTDVSGGEAISAMDADITYSGDQTFWGVSIDADDVNATTFGVAFSATSAAGLTTVSMDVATITITYTGGLSIPIAAYHLNHHLNS